jgi:hypothetical protein
MNKLQVLQGLATFAISCEANDVEFFYNYNPNSNAVYCHVYEGGKRTASNGIGFQKSIYFEDGNLESDIKQIIESVIDKYYKK